MLAYSQMASDQGLEIYQAWHVKPYDVSTATVLSKWDNFCKLQATELRARYNLFRSFSQACLCLDEWYNSVLKQLAMCIFSQES